MKWSYGHGAVDHSTLEALKRGHPGWRLLAADYAPMVLAFLHAAFIEPNVRSLPQQELVSALDDWLYQLRQHAGDDAYPRSASKYLDTWADDEHAWLRKYYPPDSDEPWFDITPAAEKALAWVAGLKHRAFIGTESRLMIVFELLRQLTEGTELDPEARIAELEKRRAQIDAEIAEIRAGDVTVMEPAQVKDRFQQMASTARGLLSDFREVEQNFRDLDRTVREKIAMWEGSKAALLDEIFGQRDAIRDSDQGASFRAFWDLLMNPERQDDLTRMLEKVFTLPAVAELAPDRRLLRIHYDWLEAGEVTQRTVARVSRQLRRYLDDQAWLENRRIMQVIRAIEHHALGLRDAQSEGPEMEIDEAAPSVELPFERPLFSPPHKPRIDSRVTNADAADVPIDALYEQVHVDKSELRARVRKLLQSRGQVSLADIVELHPIEHGVAEVVAYMSIASEDAKAVVDDARTQTLFWDDPQRGRRRATVPLVVFTR
jgi:flagellar motility protein MotE (MotC chaperone)